MKKLFCILISASMIMGTLSACGTGAASDPASSSAPQSSADATETPEGSTEDIIIGNIQDMSGTTAMWGKCVTWGVEKAVKEINDNGGLLGGRKIKLVTYDTKNDVNESINAYNRLVQQDKAVVVNGPPTSNIGIALAPIAAESKVSIYGDFMDERATTKDDGTAWEYMFLGEPSCGQQAEIIAAYAVKELGIKKFAILYDQSNAYAVSHAEPFEAYVKSKGCEIVAKETFQAVDKDYRAQLTKIKNAAPEAIFMPNYAQQDALIYQQARQMGIDQMFLGAAACFYPFLDIVGSEGKDIYFPNNVSFEDPKIMPVMKEYEAEIGQLPSLHLFLGYDNIKVLADAIERAGSTDPTAIKDALEKTKDVPGFTGNISINPDTHRPEGLSMYIVKVEGEKYVYLDQYLPEK